MPETRDEALMRQARALAYALGITVFIRTDGRIYRLPKRLPPIFSAH